jgi:hypothetical protein
LEKSYGDASMNQSLRENRPRENKRSFLKSIFALMSLIRIVIKYVTGKKMPANMHFPPTSLQISFRPVTSTRYFE